MTNTALGFSIAFPFTYEVLESRLTYEYVTTYPGSQGHEELLLRSLLPELDSDEVEATVEMGIR